MKALTGIKDVDLKILQELKDNEISLVCSVNKYVARLCENESFWLNRLLTHYKLDFIKDLKGNYTYKQLYRYLFFDKKSGVQEAIKTDNLLFLKELTNNFLNTNFDIIYEVAENNSFKILTFILLQEEDIDRRDDIVTEALFTANMKTFEWLLLMGMTNYFSYILLLIKQNFSNEITFPQIRKYIGFLGTEDINDGVLYVLGVNLTDINLENRIFLYDFLLSFLNNIITKERKQNLIKSIMESSASRIIKDKFINHVRNN